MKEETHIVGNGPDIQIYAIAREGSFGDVISGLIKNCNDLKFKSVSAEKGEAFAKILRDMSE